MKMHDSLRKLADLMSQYLSKADIYAAKTMSDMSIEIIRKRNELGLNQKDFARQLGVTQGMVSRWECGDYNFTFRTAAEICEKIGCTFDICVEPESAAKRTTYRPSPTWSIGSIRQDDATPAGASDLDAPLSFPKSAWLTHKWGGLSLAAPTTETEGVA